VVSMGARSWLRFKSDERVFERLSSWEVNSSMSACIAADFLVSDWVGVVNPKALLLSVGVLGSCVTSGVCVILPFLRMRFESGDFLVSIKVGVSGARGRSGASAG